MISRWEALASQTSLAELQSELGEDAVNLQPQPAKQPSLNHWCIDMQIQSHKAYNSGWTTAGNSLQPRFWKVSSTLSACQYYQWECKNVSSLVQLFSDLQMMQLISTDQPLKGLRISFAEDQGLDWMSYWNGSFDMNGYFKQWLKAQKHAAMSVRVTVTAVGGSFMKNLYLNMQLISYPSELMSVTQANNSN